MTECIVTNKRTGEMTEMNRLLAPLHARPPRGRVHRIPSPHYLDEYQKTYRRRVYRRPQPAGDFAVAIGCVLLAAAILLTLVWPT